MEEKVFDTIEELFDELHLLESTKKLIVYYSTDSLNKELEQLSKNILTIKQENSNLILINDLRNSHFANFLINNCLGNENLDHPFYPKVTVNNNFVYKIKKENNLIIIDLDIQNLKNQIQLFKFSNN